MSEKAILRAYTKYNINPATITVMEWLNAFLLEGEVLNTCLKATPSLQDIARVVLYKLKKYPDYYRRLDRMLKAADKYWLRNDPPELFIARES